MYCILKPTLAAAIMVVLTACSGGNALLPVSDSALAVFSGPVSGYSYVSGATLQAFAPEDPSVQLATGTLTTSPSPTASGSLTPIGLIPSSALVNPLFCNAATVAPAGTRTTAVLFLGVIDSGGLFGALLRATVANPFASASIGDKAFILVLADRASRITGTCVEDGILFTYDLTLQRGWNHVSLRFDAIDAFGNPISATLRAEAPTSSSRWYFNDFSGLGASATGHTTVTTLIAAARAAIGAH